MTEVHERPRRRPSGPPETGWALGAQGMPKPAWATIAVLLLALAVYLLLVGYVGYGTMVAVLAAAAAVNLI
jgi:hypothetical protein